jgi:hypothetical protein
MHPIDPFALSLSKGGFSPSAPRSKQGLGFDKLSPDGNF